MVQGSQGGTLPPSFDAVYFSHTSWSDRVDQWTQSATGLGFASGNRHAVEKAITDPESGLRVVVNIGAFAILKMLTEGRYLNLYERPEIGTDTKVVSQERVQVDTAVGLVDANGEADEHVYFGAVALGGVGVRYYGEYCMVLDLAEIDRDPQLFDRDSYDILLEPVSQLPNPQVLITRLLGSWQNDVRSMVLMKVLPEIDHERNVVTTGTVSEMVLKDQEFIEVHMRPNKDGFGQGEKPRSFGPRDVEEIRESPDEVAVAAQLRERETEGLQLTDIEHEWLVRREAVARKVNEAKIKTRVVTQHGQGYQWK